MTVPDVAELLVRRSTAPQYCKTAETAVCASLLSDEPPKYWACPEELLPPYAVGVLVGRHTAGSFPMHRARQVTSHNPDVLLISGWHTVSSVLRLKGSWREG